MRVQDKLSSFLNLPSRELKEENTPTQELTSKESEIQKDFKAYKLDISSVKEDGSFGSEFGFRTDEKGIFDQRFNVAARLPKDYKLEISNIRTIKNLLSEKDDLMQTLNSYFNTISAANPSFKANNSLSKEEAKSLIAGISTANSLQKLYKSSQALKEAKEDNKELISLNLHNNITDFHLENAFINSSKDKLLKPFIQGEGRIENAGLYLNFVRNDLADKKARANFFKEPLDLDISTNNFLSFSKDGKAKELLEEDNKKFMSFDLYLYINSIDKNKIDDEKLSILHEQYVNYSKNINIEKFKKESSIFDEYLTKNIDFLQRVQNNFNKDIDEKENAKVDEKISKSNERFIKQRQIEIKMAPTIEAYLKNF